MACAQAGGGDRSKWGTRNAILVNEAAEVSHGMGVVLECFKCTYFISECDKA